MNEFFNYARSIFESITPEQWINILCVAALSIVIIVLVIMKKWSTIREMAYAAMLRVEELYGSKQGKKKFNEAFDYFYGQLPFWIKFFMPEKKAKDKLQKWFNFAKDGLDDGKFNNSI